MKNTTHINLISKAPGALVPQNTVAIMISQQKGSLENGGLVYEFVDLSWKNQFHGEAIVPRSWFWLLRFPRSFSLLDVFLLLDSHDVLHPSCPPGPQFTSVNGGIKSAFAFKRQTLEIRKGETAQGRLLFRQFLSFLCSSSFPFWKDAIWDESKPKPGYFVSYCPRTRVRECGQLVVVVVVVVVVFFRLEAW